MSDDLDRHREIAWEKLAQKNPMWASCTSGKRNVDWDLQSFLQTGEREVAWITAHARAIGVMPGSVQHALDFGCGPGRLLGPIASIAGNVIGVDTSPTMLAVAKRTYQNDSRIRLTRDITSVPGASIDLVYSTFVLQHLSEPARGRALTEIARVLKDKGITIFQFPNHPRATFGGLTWKLLPLSTLMWIQRTVLRFPEAMPMRWGGVAMVQAFTHDAGLDLVASVEGLQYSPNWVDTWHIAVKR